MSLKKNSVLGIALCCSAFLFSCSDESNDSSVDIVDPVDPVDPGVVLINGSPETGCDKPMTSLEGPYLEMAMGNVAVVLSEDGCTVSFNAGGQPDHISEYWDPDGDSAHLWVPADDPDTFGNPDRDDKSGRSSPGFIDDYIGLQFDLLVSVDPQLNSGNLESTSLGAMGIAVSGAPIFNQQEGAQDLSGGSGVVQGLDRNGAHTGPQVYHYHLEPEAISYDDNNLVGIIADGFFLYGRKDYWTGDYPTDLDAASGHVGRTQHSGDLEVYHYHITNDPLINTTDEYLLFGKGIFSGFESGVR
jgi:hypothetical protein